MVQLLTSSPLQRRWHAANLVLGPQSAGRDWGWLLEEDPAPTGQWRTRCRGSEQLDRQRCRKRLCSCCNPRFAEPWGWYDAYTVWNFGVSKADGQTINPSGRSIPGPAPSSSTRRKPTPNWLCTDSYSATTSGASAPLVVAHSERPSGITPTACAPAAGIRREAEQLEQLIGGGRFTKAGHADDGAIQPGVALPANRRCSPRWPARRTAFGAGFLIIRRLPVETLGAGHGHHAHGSPLGLQGLSRPHGQRHFGAGGQRDRSGVPGQSSRI